MAGRLLIGEGPREESVFPSKIVLKKLSDKKAAQAVLHNGEKYVSEALVLYINKKDFRKKDLRPPQYAVYIKKKYGGAVERNGAKRLVRAALHQIREFILGYEIIVIPRKKMKTLKYWQIAGELQNLFCRPDFSRHGQ